MTGTGLQERLRIRSGQGDYPVLAAATVEAVGALVERIDDRVVVIDRNVLTLHGAALRGALQGSPTVVFDALETEKTLRGVEKILSCLTEHEKSRRTTLVAIGGGIIQDVSTLAAHIYHRGLPFVYVPTTLLGMADSGIGAKCGINFARFKNLIGVFHSPRQVVICLGFLDTLSDDDVRSGYGEILKLSLTGSRQFYDRLSRSLDRDGLRGPELESLVFDSLRVKQRVIEADEYETEYRRVLNYGHTFGHALEAVTDYRVPHGLGVAWGIGAANEIAVRRGVLSEPQHRAILEVIARHFPIALGAAVTVPDLVGAARKDKKSTQGVVQMALLERPGGLRLERVPFDADMERALAAYLDSGHARRRS
jgi:3-dehydroquinate synthase